MGLILKLIESNELAPKPAEALKAGGALARALKLQVAAKSICASHGVLFAIARRGPERKLCLFAREAKSLPVDIAGSDIAVNVDGDALAARVCEPTHANALAVRKRLAFARPSLIGLKKSFGFGDRLGLATPGHIRSVTGTSLAPIFAQQSMREMTRSGRTAEVVMDDAMWAVLEEGWREPHGSDADHLKTTDDIDVCLAAGFTLFTIDPGAHVDGAADEERVSALVEKFSALPWNDIETTPADCRRTLLSSAINVSAKLTVTFTEETLMRAAAKYARAVLHTAKLYRHLAVKKPVSGFELEVSVDETETPTSVAEHYYIASELSRMGVKWVSLAPRFVGAFEKGVDYIGDLGHFERTFADHVEIARKLGPYKLSLHSGSDKFSVYPVAAKHAGELIHVKTAGTSYLEALRVIAALDAALFREILDFAVGRYEEDKKTYHVSAQLANVRPSRDLKDAELPAVLDQFDARQVLHVTYGSVLTTVDAKGKLLFRERLLTTLRAKPEAYAAALIKHMGKHVKPFA